MAPAAPFDPLDYLESLGVRVVLRADGSGFRLSYGEPLKAHQRRKVQKVVEAYAGLLMLQLEGERPRSVMKLLALGVVRVEGGRYVKG